MTLEIRSFAGTGDIAKERVLLHAIQTVDIGEYVVIRSRKNLDGNPMSGSKTSYWFPDQVVEAGDIVVLYSKAGVTSKKVLESGKTAYFYYWHQQSTSWGSDKSNTVVLMKVASWSHKSPDTDISEP